MLSLNNPLSSETLGELQEPFKDLQSHLIPAILILTCIYLGFIYSFVSSDLFPRGLQ
jgi:hypothetical protein